MNLMMQKILEITIKLVIVLLFTFNIYLFGYNKGFDDGYVTGLIAQALGTDSFENYDMPYTDRDDHKFK